ncbi:YmfQ family protein [Chitinibacter sp. S2-10]|uniref:YmfQ family protein n=1 Tax=Chitinibacter sp. S2-10 TaxID=3373597 RepID=UPI00397780B7
MRLTQSDYLQQLQQLMPPGPAWEGELIVRELDVLAKSFAAVHARSGDLLREASPYQTTEMLADWERVCALPDSCSVQSSMTMADRRAAVAGKLMAIGGQSAAYFIAIAKAMGYPDATITQYSARRCGRRMGTPYGGVAWQFVWQMNLPASQVVARRSGSPMGERYRVWGNAQLECVINKLKPAHTLVRFKYA